MPCTPFTIKSKNGLVVRGFLCSRRRQARPKCVVCGRPADFLCDFVVDEKTCDKPLCGVHRAKVAPGIDYCVEHSAK